jgi:hypothetical protein
VDTVHKGDDDDSNNNSNKYLSIIDFIFITIIVIGAGIAQSV